VRLEVFPLPKKFTGIALVVIIAHQIMVLVEGIIEGVESEWEFGLYILIGHPCPLVFAQTLIESLEESADLVFIPTSTR